ncbi:MAG TPA: riboflavin synthase [Candidatus Kapabacteria bacterium]|nr:riboflavin synthase [Candidatus Kapabacteria bacterium]
MFTGIVQFVGTIQDLERTTTGIRMGIRAPEMKRAQIGASVSVDGVCLTLAKKIKKVFWFDVMKETCRKTTLGKRKNGDPVNLELSLRMGDEVGGHFVYGHVDGVGTVTGVKKEKREWLVSVRLPHELIAYMAPQGSIAINGVSLTVAQRKKDVIVVSLVPHTITQTTFKHIEKGDEVNIECDMLAKYSVSFLTSTVWKKA